MHTMYDYITHIKGVEYIISILFIAGYILFAEVLKPKPFATVVNGGKDDIEFMKRTGYRNVFKTVGKIAAAPFIGLAYVVTLPVAFFSALGAEVGGRAIRLAARSATFAWAPTVAYLTGRKHKKVSKKKQEEKK